nr:DNA polymerase III subunit alpha [Bacteriovoracaceae bacterium]
MKSFVHLHMHTQYSLLNSTLRVENVVARAKEWEMPAIAQTDFGNMFGAIDFYSECREQGVNPILGCEVYVASSSRFERNPLQDNLKNFSALSAQDEAEFHHGISRLLLLCKNNQGYQNLCQIISKSYLEGQHVRPCVDSDLLKQYAQGLIAITPSLSGEVGFFLRTQQEGKALQALLKLKAIFTDDFYVGIQRLGEVGEAELNSKILKLTQENEVQIVATNECHYLEKEEAESHEVLLSIQTGNTILDEKRPKHKAYEYYFKSAQEMWNLYADLPEACENTLKIAEKCKVDLKWKDETGKPIYHLPQFKVETKEKLEDYFKRLGREGLQARFEGPHFRNLREAGGNFQNHYNERLEAELEMIIQMGFAGYFLIVADFINWAKDKGIPVGPGRGSGAGSLVAYALRITNIDPINFNLLFERFINPERVSLPDFDVDFCQHRRDEVIRYVNEKYGKDKVGQIITFGKLQARAVIRDVSRVFALPYQEADALAKLVPEELGITLEKAFEKEGKFKELEERDPKIRQILKNSRKLEGLFRHASIHAAGIIITNEPLVNYCPLYIGKEGEQVVQFDKDYAEKIGLVKFDFLG